MSGRLGMLGVALATLLPATSPAAADQVPCTERPGAGVAIALESFRMDVGRYPTTAEGLRALRERPAGVSPVRDGARFGWDGPYLERDDDLRGPEGRPYVYRSPAADGRSYDLQTGEAGE